MEVRKHLKAKNTPYAHKLLVQHLERMRAAGHDPVAAIETSIRSGWKDVYPPKERIATSRQATNGKYAAAAVSIFGKPENNMGVIDV